MYHGERAEMAAAQQQMNVAGADEVRRPELPTALDTMDRAIGYLQATLGELQSRLDGVMRPPQSKADPTSMAIGSAPPSSGFASELHEQASRVNAAAEGVRELLARLET